MMKWAIPLISFFIFLLVPAMTMATSSETFDKKDGEIFDDWDICRTRFWGEDAFYQMTEKGFRPAIVFESLGDNADRAYKIGQEIAQKYPDRNQCAEKIYFRMK